MESGVARVRVARVWVPGVRDDRDEGSQSVGTRGVARVSLRLTFGACIPPSGPTRMVDNSVAATPGVGASDNRGRVRGAEDSR